MQTKDKKIITTICFLSIFLFNLNLKAEEFNISAKEVIIDKENQTLVGKGTVEAIDNEGRIIKANKIFYDKSKEFLTAEGNVLIFDTKGNILKSEKATYDKLNELIKTFNKTEIEIGEGYKLVTKNAYYDVTNKMLSSNEFSTFTDMDKNIVEVNMFNYQIENNLFSSIGKIKIKDSSNNKYFFKELHVDTKKEEMIGSDVSVVFDQENFGVSKESDPRFVANDIFISQNKSNLSKGVFTICKKRDDKCPPWSLKAKKISHDKAKKTIYYKHAILKVYDIPIFYFPKFFHPDPTVKRQSGFLAPFFTTNTSVGTGFGLPYYWAISNDKDLTFTPKIYTKENLLFLNEYRQAFRNGFLTLDTSYTEGYKETSKTKTDGSRNHFFADANFNLFQNDFGESNLNLKVQRTSNDTYFRIHDINTSLVNSQNTDLINEIKYSLSQNDMYLNVTGNVYEDLREETNARYEYILPNIMYGKTFFSENFGLVNFESRALYRNYETNKHRTSLTNDIIWSPINKITKKGFVNTIQAMVRNTNYKSEKTKEYKDDRNISELSSVAALKTSFPLKKDGINYSNLFSPNFMLRYAPGHMRDLSGKDEGLNYANLYSLNKTSEIEDGLSAILGFDFKINEKTQENLEREKLSISLGQVLSQKRNEDIPSKSSMDQKTSDVVGEINYNFSKIGKIDYKFSLDHNLNDINYNEISTELNFGIVKFNMDYLEEQNHVGVEHYASSGITLNFNDQNELSFSTKKNFKTESTEFYDLAYQYSIDCLKAGLVYRREYYQDNDVEQKNSLMFTITFVPFTSVSTPALNP